MSRRAAVVPARPLVAQVVPYYPPQLGGMEGVARALAEGLVEHDDVVVITTDRGRGMHPRHESRQGTHRLSIFRERVAVLAHTPISPGLFWRLLTLPRRTVVHAHLAHAFLPEAVWLTSRVRRSPYLVHFHMEVDPSGAAGFLLRPYQRFVLGPVLRGASVVLTLSDSQRSWLADRYRVPKERIRVMSNGVSPDFSRPVSPPRRDAGSGPLRLLFVGRLDAQKNVHRLLDAISLVTAPVQVTVVGSGEQETALRQRVSAEGLSSVNLVGPRRGEELAASYRDADAMVMTSDREGMPLVLLEAMFHGLPIVAADVEGVSSTVGDNGVLVPAEPAALAAAITRLATDPEHYNEVAARSFAAGAQFTWDDKIVELVDLYRHLVPR